VRLKLVSIGPAAVVNLVESIQGKGRLIHLAADLLSTLGMDYTGCPAEAIYLTSNKLTAKRLLDLYNIPTPAFCTLETLRRGEPMPRGTLIIKSVWEHASIGLDSGSQITPDSENELKAALTCRAPLLGGWGFAERYIEGRELNISLLEMDGELLVLPPAEIRFIGFSPDKPRIVDYKAKWHTDSFEYRNTVRCFDFDNTDGPLLKRLGRLALKCWDLFGLRGYARVDFRVDSDGTPFVLEVNANPCLSPDAGFAASASATGIDYQRLVRAIVAAPSLGTKRKRASSPPIKKNSGITLGGTFRHHLRERDLEEMQRLLYRTGAFVREEVEMATELIDLFLSQGEVSGYRFLVYELAGRVAGFVCYGPIPGTQTSFDVYWISTDVALQNQGIGRRMMAEAEERMRRCGARRIFIDTSAKASYLKTHLFYESIGYVKEAVLRDFYTQGDDKLIYSKTL
jgi:D-alanine-D-alanine ligase